MKITLKWFAFGLIVFLFALVYTIPAHLAFPYLPSAVHIGRLNGTLWNAQATDFAFDDLSLSEVRWRIQPLYLLTGRLGTSVEFSHRNMSGSGDIILGYRSLDLEDLHVKGNTEVIDPYLSALGVSIDGKFDLILESIEITQAGPQDAQGRLIVYSTRLTSTTELNLGDIELNLEQQGDKTVATLKNNTANALDLRGEANINPEWRYSSDIRISPTSTTPEAIRQTLALLGPVDAKGAVTVQHNGRIPLVKWLPHLKENDTSVSSE